MRYGNISTIVTKNGIATPGKVQPFPLTWLWVLLPGIVLLWAPFRLTVPVWLAPNSQVIFQAWIPLVVAFLCWSRRSEWRETAAELVELFPDPRDPRRSGNLVLVLLGGLGLLFGLVASIPAVSMFCLCLMVCGGCYALAGPFLLRVVLSPLLFLFLMVPFPSGLLQNLTLRFQMTGAAMLGGALELLATKNRVLFTDVTMQGSGYTLQVTPSLSGLGTFFFAVVGTLAYVIWRRSSFGRGLVALIIAGFVSCVVSLLRLLTLGLIANGNRSVAEICVKIPALPAILLIWGLTWFFTRRLLSPRNKVQPEVDA